MQSVNHESSRSTNSPSQGPPSDYRRPWKHCHCPLGQTYLRFCLENAGQEDEVSDEEADTKMQVDGCTRPMNGTAELERQDAKTQTQQGEDQSDLCDQLDGKGLLRGGNPTV